MALDKNGTVIDKEIVHFSKVGAKWWNTSERKSSLHTLNDIRVPYIFENVARTKRIEPSTALKDLTILDTGCGAGILTEALAKYGARVVGLDASEDLIKVARNHLQTLDEEWRGNVEYVATTIEEYSILNKGRFDVVVSSEVIEHVSNPDKFVQHCSELTKPGGSLVITSINKTMVSWLKAIVYLEYLTNTIPIGTHAWNQFVPPSVVTDWVTKYGCKDVTVQGMTLHASTVEWSLTSRTSSFYLLHCVKI